MLSRLLEFRPEDCRDALIGFSTLAGIMTGHSLLETARDTLFLSRLPAHELPWAYIAIAVLALFITAESRRALLSFSRRRVLSLSLLGGSVVTAALWWISSADGAWVVFAVYVWTGLLATVSVLQFWLLAGEVFDVGQAKRVFAFVGAGGLVGAALGSALSGVLLYFFSARSLLLAAAAIFSAAALVPLRFSKGRAPVQRVRRREIPRGFGVGLLRTEPYLRRLFWIALVSSILVTGVDFVFKSMVSVDIAPEQLGFFFARFYAVMNGLALVIQLLVAPRLLRGLGVNGSLLLLPAILFAGSAAFVLTLGLGAVLMLRAADGALRHSLNRTGTEILYFPLPPGLRDRFKAVTETVGQRGGQALASVLLLVGTIMGAKAIHIGIALAAFAGFWLFAIYGLKPHYLELFRRNLREGTIETQVEVPDLDLHSLEALMSALSSENDDEVFGALDLLAAYRKTNLVPALDPLPSFGRGRASSVRALRGLQSRGRAAAHGAPGAPRESEDSCCGAPGSLRPRAGRRALARDGGGRIAPRADDGHGAARTWGLHRRVPRRRFAARDHRRRFAGDAARPGVRGARFTERSLLVGPDPAGWRAGARTRSGCRAVDGCRARPRVRSDARPAHRAPGVP